MVAFWYRCPVLNGKIGCWQNARIMRRLASRRRYGSIKARQIKLGRSHNVEAGILKLFHMTKSIPEKPKLDGYNNKNFNLVFTVAGEFSRCASRSIFHWGFSLFYICEPERFLEMSVFLPYRSLVYMIDPVAGQLFQMERHRKTAGAEN